MKKRYAFICLLFVIACSDGHDSQTKDIQGNSRLEEFPSTGIVVLGNIQDAGSPQIGCTKECCKDLFEYPDPNRLVTSLGLFDKVANKTYLFEASPDMAVQMKLLLKVAQSDNERVDGIFLTHAHIGHYSGLMFLGKEAMGAKDMPVYCMPRMKEFLINNAPWSQLLTERNVVLEELENGKIKYLGKAMQVKPLVVPHRDEFSETVGYCIKGPKKSALFIPDIDKWEKWSHDILTEIKKVDYAFLDATFFSGNELDNRDMSQIPHPFILESLEKFKSLSKADKRKIIFIHFNHTNPVIRQDSKETKLVLEQGFRIARLKDVFEL